MADMERYYKLEKREVKTSRARQTAPADDDWEVITDRNQRDKGCRSNSIKNRMLLIELNKDNKHEWVVLPHLPSKLGF